MRKTGNEGKTIEERRANAKVVILQYLAKGYSIKRGCKAVGLSRVTYNSWLTADPEFGAAAAIAIEDGSDEFEDRAKERAFKHSDSLMMFLLSGRRPQKYRRGAEDKDASVTVIIKGGLPEVPAEPTPDA